LITEKIPYNPVNSKRSLYNKEKAQKTAHYLLKLFSALLGNKKAVAPQITIYLPCNSPYFYFIYLYCAR